MGGAGKCFAKKILLVSHECTLPTSTFMRAVCMERAYVPPSLVYPNRDRTLGSGCLLNMGFMKPFDDWAIGLFFEMNNSYFIFVIFQLIFLFRYYLFNSYLSIYSFYYLLILFLLMNFCREKKKVKRSTRKKILIQVVLLGTS